MIKFNILVTKAAGEQILRGDRKTKQRWMNEANLELMEKRKVKNKSERYKTLHRGIRKICNKAQEKWINVK